MWTYFDVDYIILRHSPPRKESKGLGFFVVVVFTFTHKRVSQSVCDKRVKMQDAKLDIDVDVKILKDRFGQNFIIYN